MRPVIRFLAIALVYFVGASLGSMLAISPGYSSPFWPPAGIALSATLLLGNRSWAPICAGAFLSNILLELDTATALTLFKSVSQALVIGIGAALQAVVGATLIRRFVGFPSALDEGRAVFRYILLAGPVSCLVNSTIGVSSIYFGNVIELSEVGYNWWTWWVGDTIAVLLMTPLIFIAAAEPRAVWRRRWLSVGVPICAGILVSVVAFWFTRTWERDRIAAKVDGNALPLAAAIEDTFETHLEILHSVESLFDTRGEVDRESFHRFVRHALDRRPTIQALEWIPRVSAGRRSAFEAKVRREGYPNFEITEANADGDMVRRNEADEYYPVTFVEPFPGNETALGFDLASNATRSAAMSQARSSGQPTATRRIRLVQETTDQTAFLVFVPVYRSDSLGASESASGELLNGFVLGVFRVGALIEASLEGMNASGFDIDLTDVELGRAPDKLETTSSATPSGDTSFSFEFEFAERYWTLSFQPTVDYTEALRSWQSWTVLTTALLFTGIFGGFLLVVSGHTTRVETLVDERTGELAASNEEIRRNTKQLELAKNAAERGSEAKSRFLAHMSHELRTPLNSVIGFTRILLKNKNDALDPKELTYLGRIDRNGTHLLHLINEVLDLAKIESGQTVVDFEPIDVDELLLEVCAQFEEPARERGITVRATFPSRVSPMDTDRGKLKQVLLNLVGNAVKFTRDGEVLIRLEASATDGRPRSLEVRDTGIGISPDKLTDIFEAFHQVDDGPTREFEGTGLGLAISRSLCQVMGYRLLAESVPGTGSTFRIVFPDPLDVTDPAPGNATMIG